MFHTKKAYVIKGPLVDNKKSVRLCEMFIHFIIILVGHTESLANKLENY